MYLEMCWVTSACLHICNMHTCASTKYFFNIIMLSWFVQSPTPLWLAAGMLDRLLTDGHTWHLPAMLSDFGLHFSPSSFEVRR